MRAPQGQMGTFAGVFTPSILTILGLILFLRLGFIVGTTGLAETLLIIVLAHSISILTSISLAAIATNLKIRGGGVYYIISRTLGLPFGGAIGVVLFGAQAISVGFYCVGFAEGLTTLLGHGHDTLLNQAVAGAAVIVLCAVAWLGADLATRLQYVVMALLVLALVAFATGAVSSWSGETLAANFDPPQWGGFWIAFAIFFPAVTGFTQGVNMSGDLRDAGTSIPRGTAAAVALSFVIYIAVAILCAAAIPRSELIDDYSVMKSVAAYAPLVDAGIISATLSSALASFLGAPRILQSLARDRIFPFLLPFAEGAGPDNNPRRGVILTGVIAVAVVALGNLNLIASIVTMFFVVTYGLLNYATYFEARAKSPSFRPTLRWYHAKISLLGWLSAMGVMLAIDLVSGILAIAIIFAIYQYLQRNASAARWADGQRSYHLQVVREHLLAANARIEHPRDWRPQILAFSNDAARRTRLLTFADWIEGHSGLTTVVRILEGSGRHMRRAREEAEEALAKELKAKGFDAFPLVVHGPDLAVAVQTVVQAAGIGPLRANTALVNWVEQTAGMGQKERRRRFGRNLHAAFLLGCNIVLLDSGETEWNALMERDSEPRTIDVWWQDNRSGQLSLVLAYLLTRNDFWRNARIRVLTLVEQDLVAPTRERIGRTLADVRIRAEVEVLPSGPGNIALITETSRNASIVFLMFQLRQETFVDAFGNDLDALLPGLPVLAMIMAAEDIDLSADPDEGEVSARAAAADALADAARQRDQAARAVEKAAAAIAELTDEIKLKGSGGADAAALEQKRARLRELEAEFAGSTALLERYSEALAAARQRAEKLGLAVEVDARTSSRGPSAALLDRGGT